ncbi:hypothetical protein Fot_33349 [Forsythia ovata]|uniref:Uncharacterized protein n=1 Tax=Forsythia ovata TaxID=205694 RepID=A0ABD1TAF3_9LAMI
MFTQNQTKRREKTKKSQNKLGAFDDPGPHLRLTSLSGGRNLSGGVSRRVYLSVVTVGYHACGKSSGITTYYQTRQLSSSKKFGRRLVSIEVLRRAPKLYGPSIFRLSTSNAKMGSLRCRPSWAIYVGRLAGLSKLNARLGSLRCRPSWALYVRRLAMLSTSNARLGSLHCRHRWALYV